MSTKTTIKRIALVAAVAAAFGGLSTVAAQATPLADSLAVSATTVSATAGATSKVVVTQTFLSTSNTDEASVTAYLTAAPAGNVAVPTFETGTVTGYNDAGSPTRNAANGTTSNSISTEQTTANTYTAANYNLDFTPTLSGSYTVKLVPQIGTHGSLSTTGVNAASITITYTVAAKAAISAASSTAYLGATTVLATSSTDTNLVTSVLASKTPASPSVPVGNINVTESNGSTSAALTNSDAVALTASVSGPGLVSFDQDPSHAGKAVTNSSAFSGTGGSTQAALNQHIYIFADGTSGIGTITWSAGTTVLGTKTVTFYGSAASITATVVNSIISTAADAAATSSGTATPATPGHNAISVLVADSSGNPVQGVTVYANSDNTAVINASYLQSNATTDSTGTAYFSLQGVKAGTANISFTLEGSAIALAADTAAGKTIITAPAVAIRVGTATASAVTITFDSAAYVPGQIATVSVNVFDSAGLPVPNGVYTVFTGALTSSLALTTGTLQGTAAAGTFNSTPAFVSPTLTAGQVWIKNNAGSATATVNMPVVAGTVTLTGTGASGLAAAQAGLAITGATIVGAGATADAANAATDAANQATDAANNAIDAANAAADTAQTAADAAQSAADTATQALAAAQDANQNATDALSAAQEATDAGNAATDAANAAADSADAATAAAQDASDKAAAALAAVTQLSAQFTTLAAQVAKVLTAVQAIAKATTPAKKK